MKSVIWGILVLSILGLFIIIILCLTGVINVTNKCGRSNHIPKYKEISFSAAASGQVELSWDYNTTGGRNSTDFDFPVNIWWPPKNPSSGIPDKTVTLVSSDAKTDQENYDPPTGGADNVYSYTATLDGNKYFEEGSNWVALAAEITQDANSVSSAYSDTISVTLAGGVTSAATWASPFFLACGFSHLTYTDIKPTKMRLMWKQIITPNIGVKIEDICYTILFKSNTQYTRIDLASMGFKTGYTYNGIDIAVTADTITVKMSGSPKITKMLGTECCCLPDDDTDKATIFLTRDDPDQQTYYISILSDSDAYYHSFPPVDDTYLALSQTGDLYLTTYESDCTTLIKDPVMQLGVDISKAVVTAKRVRTGLFISSSCKGDGCTYDETVSNSDFNDITYTCNSFTQPSSGEDGYLASFTGGAKVTLTLLRPTSYTIPFLLMWMVEESILNPTVTYKIHVAYTSGTQNPYKLGIFQVVFIPHHVFTMYKKWKMGFTFQSNIILEVPSR